MTRPSELARPVTFGVIVLLAALVLVGTATMPVTAQETRSGDEIVIGEDETVSGDLATVAGSVVVDGTVEGDLSAIAGSVRVGGEVDGDVNAVSGAVLITGSVGGDVNAAAGQITVDGDVGNDANLAAGGIVLGPSAAISGELTYAAGSLDRDQGAVVEGGITQAEPVEPQIPGTAATIAGIVYSLLANLVLGAILLFALPEFSRTTTVRAITETARSAGIGLLVLFAAPVALALLLITIVGIPIALGGFVLYGLLIWIGYVYGAITVGSWLLVRADANSGRWAALLLGLVVVAIVGAIPVVGWLVGLAVTVTGMGAVSLGLVRGFRERRGRDERRERLNDHGSQWPEDDERRYRSLQEERQPRTQRPSSEDFDPGQPTETELRPPDESDDWPPDEDNRQPDESDDRSPDEDDRPPQ